MPSSELTEWMAYYRLEPFGQERDNLVNTNRRKNTPAVPPSEFMYKDRRGRAEDETVGFLAGLKALAKPKKVNRGKN